MRGAHVMAVPRSWLFVPAGNEARILKAARSEADAVVFDLEDAVQPLQKGPARNTLAAGLAGLEDRDPSTVWVRVNSGGDDLREDLEVAVHPRVCGLILPKVHTGDEIVAARRAVDAAGGARIRLAAMIETASAVLRAAEIASTGHVDYFLMGEQDLGADLGFAMDVPWESFHSIRVGVGTVCAAHGLPGPVGSPFMAVRAVAGVSRAAARLCATGFSGMVAIHPDQVEPINAAFTPSADDVSRASRTLAAFDEQQGRGVGVYSDNEGNMIDEAVVRRARCVLERAAVVRP